jgi:monovalent cation/hydrogen antiporter
VEAARLAGLVIVAIVVTRFVVAMVWNRLAVHFASVRGRSRPPTWGQGVVVAWSGMRGLVTLATAFALPIGFPQRDLVVLTAFAVVSATLVVQGLTLAPLIRQLRLDRIEDPASDLADVRRTLARVRLEKIDALGARNDLTLRDFTRLRARRRRCLPRPSGCPDTAA